jgi:hypothetical protein
MKNDNNFTYEIVQHITAKENRGAVKRMILLGAVWTILGYASMYGFLYLFLWVMKY